MIFCILIEDVGLEVNIWLHCIALSNKRRCIWHTFFQEASIRHLSDQKGKYHMKKILISIVIMLALLVAPTPAMAGEKVPVGDRINIFNSGAIDFPAGAPFHIAHGWLLDSNTDAIGVYDFKLEVDGTLLKKEDFVDRMVTSGDPDTFLLSWTFNFPNGMTGTHTFTGHWLGPCQGGVGPCSSPNEKVELRVSTMIVTFISP